MCRDDDDEYTNGNVGNNIGNNNYDTERLRQLRKIFLSIIAILYLVGNNYFNISLASIIRDPSSSTSHADPLRTESLKRLVARARRDSLLRIIEEKFAVCSRGGGDNKNHGSNIGNNNY